LSTARRRAALLKAHPDKGGTKEAFRRVGLAFAWLSDPAKRELYDMDYSALYFAAVRGGLDA